jgi:ribonucleoside-diphosphate reductase alpha chain
VYIKEDEWVDVGSWVYKNFDLLSGVAFLPYDGGTYRQAPYQELTEEEYNDWVEKHPTPKIDWSDLRFYETEDTTTGSQELACAGGVCDVIAIGDVKDG